MFEDASAGNTVEGVGLDLAESGGRTVGDFGGDVVAGTKGGAKI